MDLDLEFFLSQWGEPTAVVPACGETLGRLSNYVPATLVGVWRQLGFSVFRDGLMALCNPLDWQEIADDWLAGTELESLDRFIPVMRGAFGDMRLFGAGKGYHATLSPVWGAYFGERGEPHGELDFLAKSTLTFSVPEDFELGDKTVKFAKALDKLGPIAPNEIYGFVPVLPLGGTRDLAHLQKVDAFAHLSILRQATGELRGIMEAGDLYR